MRWSWDEIVQVARAPVDSINISRSLRKPCAALWITTATLLYIFLNSQLHRCILKSLMKIPSIGKKCPHRNYFPFAIKRERKFCKSFANLFFTLCCYIASTLVIKLEIRICTFIKNSVFIFVEEKVNLLSGFFILFLVEWKKTSGDVTLDNS